MSQQVTRIVAIIGLVPILSDAEDLKKLKVRVAQSTYREQARPLELDRLPNDQ